MEVSYNLRYQKSNFSNRILLDKEGEVVIYAKGFRLKGKGAGDKGELINFSEIKEFYYRDKKVIFITFAKEKYVLSDSGPLFDQMLMDIYKARNEFLMDALFMKGGKLKAEFECDFQRLSKFGKLINKGIGKIRLYERSMIVIPSDQDAFSLHYDFVNFYEFDEYEYALKVVMDLGSTIVISKLGNDFDTFKEKMESLLGGMYEKLVNEILREAFPHFNAATLLKFGYKMKGGKAVSLKDITKMDADLAESVEEFIFEDKTFKDKVSILRDLTNDYEVFYGLKKDESLSNGFIKWVMYTIPSKNIVAFSILPRWKEGESETNDTLFYRIIMEQGNAADKVADKMMEVDQALITLDFAKDPCYKDKRELKHSPYQYAIRKLPFLRILRKSFIGKVGAVEVKDWQAQVKEMFTKSEIKS